jgi:hypothetical protein
LVAYGKWRAYHPWLKLAQHGSQNLSRETHGGLTSTNLYRATDCLRERDVNWSGQSLILIGVEYFFACPYCSEWISMVLDTSVKRQTYIEDCEVCCRPIEVLYAVKNDEGCKFEARAI